MTPREFLAPHLHPVHPRTCTGTGRPIFDGDARQKRESGDTFSRCYVCGAFVPVDTRTIDQGGI